VARASNLMPAEKATDLSKQFGPVQALSNVDLEIYPGETIALAGDSGAGKSTLVALLSGLAPPDTTQILVDGRAMTSCLRFAAHWLPSRSTADGCRRHNY
jgi:ABC-type sugar transport system ATPase subunit